LSVGVRFPNFIFVFIIAVLIYMHCGRKQIYPYATGVIIPLFIVSWINFVTYGDIFESGYGNPLNYVNPIYLVIASLAVAVYYWIKKNKISLNSWVMLVVCAILVVSIFFMWDKVVFLVTSFYARMFDMSLEPTSHEVSYKKGLFQASPFLILSFLIFYFIPKGIKGRLFIFMLLLAGFNIFFFLTRHHHGGLDETYSMRYFMESIPYLVILSVYSFERLFKKIKKSEIIIMILVFVTVSFLYLREGHVLYSLKDIMRVLPAVISLLTLASCMIYLKFKLHRRLALILIAVMLAISLSFSYADWKVLRTYLSMVESLTNELEANIVDDSAVFVRKRSHAILFTPLKTSKRVRLVVGEMFNHKDTPGLVDFYVKEDIPVYYLNLYDKDKDWITYFNNLSARYDDGKVNSVNVYVGDRAESILKMVG
jgi:hypothetical protein